MNLYRITLTIEDECQAKDQEEAWVKFQERVKGGYYGPTMADVEFIEEVQAEEAAAAEE